MTWTVVQFNDHENGATSSTTVAVTLAAPVTSGNLVVVFGGVANAVNNLISITDDKGNNYTLQDFQESTDNSYGWHSAWFTPVTNGPTTITYLGSSAQPFRSLLVIEVAPPAGTVAAFDVSIINAQATPTTAADGVTSTSKATNAADIVIGGAVSTVSATLAVGTGFTAIQTNAGSNSFTTEYLVQSAAGSQACTWTQPGGNPTVAALLAFSAINPPSATFVGMVSCEW